MCHVIYEERKRISLMNYEQEVAQTLMDSVGAYYSAQFVWLPMNRKYKMTPY